MMMMITIVGVMMRNCCRFPSWEQLTKASISLINTKVQSNLIPRSLRLTEEVAHIFAKLLRSFHTVLQPSKQHCFFSHAKFYLRICSQTREMQPIDLEHGDKGRPPSLRAPLNPFSNSFLRNLSAKLDKLDKGPLMAHESWEIEMVDVGQRFV